MPLTWSSAAQQFTNISVSTASVYYGSTLSFSVSTQGFANGGTVYYSTTGTAGVQTEGTAVVSNYFGDLGLATIPVSTTRTINTGSFAVNFYQGSISGNQISNYNFSPGALSPDPFFTATSLLISPAGPGPTALTDLSGNSTSTTVVGTPEVRSFIPFTTPGVSSSMFFNAGTNYLTLPLNAGLALGAGDWTVECWCYTATTDAGQHHIFDTRTSATGSTNPNLYLTGSTIQWLINGSSIVSGTLVINTWTHVAVVRRSGTTTMYLNGSNVSSVADSVTYTAAQFQIGKAWDNNYWNGYISNFRMVKGLGVYTGNFTPPTSPLQVTQAAGTNIAAITTQTVLLLLQASQSSNNNSFYDSANTLTQIGFRGSPIQGTFSPYSQYATLFNGTNQNLATTGGTGGTGSPIDLATGTPNWTIEFWFYLNSVAGTQTLFCKGGTSGSINPSYVLSIAAGTGQWVVGNGSSGGVAQNFPSATVVNTWYHFALVRNGGWLNAFVNGITLTPQAMGFVMSNTGNNLFTVGRASDGATNFVNGYVRNFRIIKGTASYATNTNFTPSPLAERLAATTNTVFLACQGPYGTTSTDYSTVTNTVTNVGSAPARLISTTTFLTTPYSTSTIAGSIYFNGTSDVVTSTNATSVNFGTSNFTVECWVYIPSYSTGDANEKQLIEAVQSAGAFQLYITGGGSGLRWGVNGVNGNIILPAGLIPVAQWFHVAVSRTGTGANQTFGFINGVLTISATDNNTYSQVGFGIGASRAGANYFAGYLSGIRIVNGYAMYGGAFSPSLTPPTASLTGTTTIINGNGSAIYDVTGNNNIMTTGTSIISTATVKFGSNSIQLLGTSYLNVISTTGTSFGSIIGTADFTVEMWIYPTNVTGSFYLMTIGTEAAGRYSVYLVNGVLTTNLNPNIGGYALGGSIGANNWTHIAVARQGSTIRGFINGVLLGTTDSNSGSIGNSNIIKVGSDSVGAATFQGFMSDVRLTRGVARYTASFTSATTYSQLI